MSLISDLKGHTTGKTPAPAEIQNQVQLAQSTLADLEAQHGAAALEALAKTPGADATLRDLEQQLVAQRQRVQTLRAAHKAATEREEAAIQAQRISLQRTQLRALKKHVETRNAAAAELSKSIADCAAHYRALQQASAKARAATPIGLKFPDGAGFEDHAIRNLVMNEFWRVSAQPGDADKLALPGAQFPHVVYQHNPAGITALDVAIKTGSDFALSKMKAPE